MMTKKSEMAEWIMDIFRRAKLDAGQIVMMYNIQNRLLELNPKERDLFVNVANELIQNGYFTFEEQKPQSLRLTEKGRDYIYDPEAVLDCCYDQWTPNRSQSQYLANWHDSFVAFVNHLKGLIAGFMSFPAATEEDLKGLSQCLNLLNDKVVLEIEMSLSEGIVNKDILDKIERLNTSLIDVAVEHLQTGTLVKEFWRHLAYLKIEQDKKAEEMRLGLLKIPF